MIALKIDIRGLGAVERDLRGVISDLKKNLDNARKEIGEIVVKKAERYAPRLSGDLEDSIKSNVRNDKTYIGVPRHSKAGDYAYRRHEENYNLSDRSKSKGSGVGNKFIERAIEDEEQKIISAVEKAIDKAVKDF